MTEPDETLEEGHPSTPLTVQPAGGRSIRRLLVTVGMSAALVAFTRGGDRRPSGGAEHRPQCGVDETHMTGCCAEQAREDVDRPSKRSSSRH
jgi:hypothetical protein